MKVWQLFSFLKSKLAKGKERGKTVFGESLLSLGELEIGRTIGMGTFGSVHIAYHKTAKQIYALKIINKRKIIRMKQMQHIQSERKILQKHQHPFMVVLNGTFQDEINLYLLMEYVPGGELFSLLRKKGRFPNEVAKFYAAELVHVLGYLHQAMIIYRDLKPENVLLDARGHIKLVDFGFAKCIPSSITRTVCGTPEYMAPEIIRGLEYGFAADWYALGIFIYEMLVGLPPFLFAGGRISYDQVLNAQWNFPPGLDPLAVDIIVLLCNPDPTARLGALLNGKNDIMSHPWFRSIQWDKLLRKEKNGPYVPQLVSSTDTSFYEVYKEETILDPSQEPSEMVPGWEL